MDNDIKIYKEGEKQEVIEAPHGITPMSDRDKVCKILKPFNIRGDSREWGKEEIDWQTINREKIAKAIETLIADKVREAEESLNKISALLQACAYVDKHDNDDERIAITNQKCLSEITKLLKQRK